MAVPVPIERLQDFLGPPANLVTIAPSVTMLWASYYHSLSSAGAFSTNPSFPFDNSRRVILVLWYVQLCLKISRAIVDKLEICKHALVSPWHDAFGEGRFARGEAVTAELMATGKRRLHWFIVYEVGPDTLTNGHR